MLVVNQYKDILLEEFYLDENEVVRRKKDGYHGRFKAGDKASIFIVDKNYLAIHIPRTRKTLKLCHLLCLLRGVYIPDNMEIDHIDGNVQNDSKDNLRIVNTQLNSKNRKKRSDNKSGITGIHWSEYHKHYVIRKSIKGKRISRSRKTLEEAKLVLEELINIPDGYTERHGK